MGLTLIQLELSLRNFLEALAFRIWILVIKTGAGRKEIENDWQDFAHRPKTWKKWTKKIGPNLGPSGPDHHRRILLSKTEASFQVPSLQAMLLISIIMEHQAWKQRTKPNNTTEQSNVWILQVAPPKFWTLRATQDPNGFWGSSTLRKSISWLNLISTEFSPKSWFFMKILKFHHHWADLDPARTLSQKFSGSSRVQNLNPHGLCAKSCQSFSISFRPAPD